MFRHYFRDKVCLEPFSLDLEEKSLPYSYKPLNNICPLCGGKGKIEYMGRVQTNNLITEEAVPECDNRCVQSVGPICRCKCQEKNHGSGRLITIENSNPVPKNANLKEKAIKHRKEYEELLEKFIPIIQENNKIVEDYRQAVRETGYNYEKHIEYSKGQRKLNLIKKITGAKSHAIRMRS